MIKEKHTCSSDHFFVTSVHKLSTFDDAMDRVMMENNLKLEGDCSTSEDDEENEENNKKPAAAVEKQTTIKKQSVFSS